MKKVVYLFVMLLALSFAFVSCGGEQATEEATGDSLTQEVTETATADFSKGIEVYKAKCQVCHQAEGAGLAGAFPPLKNLKDRQVILDNIKNGKKSANYPAPMVPVPLTDEEANAVADYVMSLK